MLKISDTSNFAFVHCNRKCHCSTMWKFYRWFRPCSGSRLWDYNAPLIRLLIFVTYTSLACLFNFWIYQYWPSNHLGRASPKLPVCVEWNVIQTIDEQVIYANLLPIGVSRILCIRRDYNLFISLSYSWKCGILGCRVVKKHENVCFQQYQQFTLKVSRLVATSLAIRCVYYCL